MEGKFQKGMQYVKSKGGGVGMGLKVERHGTLRISQRCQTLLQPRGLHSQTSFSLLFFFSPIFFNSNNFLIREKKIIFFLTIISIGLQAYNCLKAGRLIIIFRCIVGGLVPYLNFYLNNFEDFQIPTSHFHLFESSKKKKGLIS